MATKKKKYTSGGAPAINELVASEWGSADSGFGMQGVPKGAMANVARSSQTSGKKLVVKKGKKGKK